MRDYSNIPVTKRKWENWDCCPEYLRIDLNHQVSRVQEYSEMRYSSKDIGKQYNLNQVESKIAVRMYHVNIKDRTEDSVHAAILAFLSLIPPGAMNVRKYSFEYKHAPAYIHKIIKKYGIEPVAVIGELRYYTPQVLEHFFKKGL